MTEDECHTVIYMCENNWQFVKLVIVQHAPLTSRTQYRCSRCVLFRVLRVFWLLAHLLYHTDQLSSNLFTYKHLSSRISILILVRSSVSGWRSPFPIPRVGSWTRGSGANPPFLSVWRFVFRRFDSFEFDRVTGRHGSRSPFVSFSRTAEQWVYNNRSAEVAVTTHTFARTAEVHKITHLNFRNIVHLYDTS